MRQKAKKIARLLRIGAPLSRQERIEKHPEIWTPWATIQQQLEWQCTLMPRSPWVERLIQEYQQQLRLHQLLRGWHARLGRNGLLAKLRNLLALMPLDDALQQAGMALLQGLNTTCLKALEAHLSASRQDLVIVITGCQPRLAKLQHAIQRFSAADAGCAVIGVIGDQSLRDWELRFDSASGILSLPISDAYEALPLKVGWAILAIAMAGRRHGVLKVDDDAMPADLECSLALLSRLQRDQQAAAGYPITTDSVLSLDRGWHIGKSSAAANRIAFNTIATKNWMSGGTGYLLAPSGVAIVARHALHSWGFFETMLYEDITISMILLAADARVRWLDDPGRIGISSERADEIAQGLWLYDHETLS